ncbi:MAG: PDZ domain-containing protein [Ruminococcaceae bacterium]|nr:PDZ domain-containing protein [Oscillospiraceae bacterium]
MKKTLNRLLALLCALVLCLTSASALSVEQAIALLELYYVDTLPAAVYEADTLDEVFTALGDPYTYYMTAEDYANFQSKIEGGTSITGIGAGIEYSSSGIVIISVLPESGAEAAGLKAGDVIIAVDGVGCVPAGEQHRELILGEEGTAVTVTVQHADGAVCDYRIVRKTFQLQNTILTLKNGVGWIDCGSFGTQTALYFQNGISENDENVDSWVVDLRSNTGGLADMAVSALGTFVGAGPKLYYRLGNGASFPTKYTAPAWTDKNVIVLVNGYSASASEIFCGGIRADRAGIIVGSRTYGKGSAQQVMDRDNYPDVFDGDALKITVYRFYCADGNTTDKIGVLPTLYVSDQYTESVAKLLSSVKPESSEFLILTLNGNFFYLDPAAARADGLGDALDELLSALPPDASVVRVADGSSEQITSKQALERYGQSSLWRGFSDVSESPYATQIDTLGTYGILLGNGAGYFAPTGTLTRGQLCAMLAQALNVTSSASGLFLDVPDNSWYAGDVNAIATLGLVNGVGANRFDPDGALTQEQFITIMGRLTRFLNFKVDDYALELTEDELSEFSSLQSWARTGASVLTDYERNMLYTDLGNIDLSAPVTREQAAATLCNILKTLRILTY